MKLEPSDKEWLELKKKKNIMYAHCRTCLADIPEGESPYSYSDLEGIIDLETGVITLGCKRHNIPIVSAMMPTDVVKHIAGCGCDQCKPGTTH